MQTRLLQTQLFHVAVCICYNRLSADNCLSQFERKETLYVIQTTANITYVIVILAPMLGTKVYWRDLVV